MCKDIMGSRIKVNAWNPNELEETALPPCHSEFQIIGVPLTFEERRALWVVRHVGEMRKTAENFKVDSQYLTDVGIPDFGFELHWNQRSVDTFLGLPFNIASYGLLAKVIEHLTGFPALAIEGTLKCVHFYDNQYEAVDTLLSRPFDTHGASELRTLELPDTFLEFLEVASEKDFILDNYTSDDAIKVEMLAPKD